MTKDDVLFGCRQALSPRPPAPAVAKACRRFGVHRSTFFSITHPGFGPKRVAGELAWAQVGRHRRLAQGVWKVLCCHGLNTSTKRLALVTGYAAPYESPRDQAQSAISTSFGRAELVGIRLTRSPTSCRGSP